MLTLRRSAWMRWLPPIESASPSPVTTQTSRSGRVDREAGGDRRRPPVDRVHPVGVHVVREPRCAADPGDEDRVLAAHAELGQQHLHGGEDRVVPAARAPADLLVARPVLARRDGNADIGHQDVPCAVLAGAPDATPALEHPPLDLGHLERHALHLRAADRHRRGSRPARASPAGRGCPRGRAPSRRSAAPHRGSPGRGSGGRGARAPPRARARAARRTAAVIGAVGRAPAEDEQRRRRRRGRARRPVDERDVLGDAGDLGRRGAAPSSRG